MPQSRHRRLAGVLARTLFAASAVAALAAPARALIPVNGGLYLLVDNSDSISNTEWNLQISGYGAAFAAQSVQDLITAKGPIAVGFDAFATSPGVFDIPWKIVTTGAKPVGQTCATGWCTPTEYAQLVNTLQTVSAGGNGRPGNGSGYTDLSEAIVVATTNINNPLLNGNVVGAEPLEFRFFKTIDLGTDGVDNVSGEGGTIITTSASASFSPDFANEANNVLAKANAARAAGINLNALVITGNSFYNFETASSEAQCFTQNGAVQSFSCLPKYARDYVIGNNGFVEVTNGFDGFAIAARNKLEREIPAPFSFAALLPMLGIKKLRNRYRSKPSPAAAG